MSADPNKKSARTFQCRDVLWETFEQMARELECSVDYLINEAMKQYARQRSYGGGAARTPYPAPGRGVEQQQPTSDRGYGPPPSPAAAPPAMPPLSRPPAGGPLPPPPGGRVPPPGRPAPLPMPPPPRGAMPVPPPRAPSGMAMPAMPAVPRSVPPPAPGPRSVPPPLPRGPTPVPGAPAMGNGFPAAPAVHAATLSLIYQGERYAITKDRFVIGRGKQSSDLTLKDPNVSRQHAMVEFQNGVYFMVDMGSTNGVEFNGQRIARKQIAEGDVFRICDHEIIFTYR